MMPQETKTVFRQQLPIYIAQVVLCGLMVCVYLLLRRCTAAVLLGGLVGMGISLANHTAMIFSLLRAEKSENPQMGQLKVRGNYMLRMILMAGALVLAVKVVHTDPIATIVPIALMRIALFVGSFMIKTPQETPAGGYRTWEDPKDEEETQ